MTKGKHTEANCMNKTCVVLKDKEYCVAQMLELEKENAELKKQLFTLRNERNTFLAQNEQYEEDLIGINENLTKAKELLKWFAWYFREGSANLVPYKHKVKEAEQFLSEVEK